MDISLLNLLWLSDRFSFLKLKLEISFSFFLISFFDQLTSCSSFSFSTLRVLTLVLNISSSVCFFSKLLSYSYLVLFLVQQFLGQETDILFLGPNNGTLGQFLVCRGLVNRRRKNNLKLFWLMYESNTGSSDLIFRSLFYDF